MIRFLALATATLLTVAPPVFAQDDDGPGFLTRTIQDALSGAGRNVTITGFSGALSSRATLERLTIADDEGVWLELTDAVLDWNRSALLRGRLEVDELSAESLTVTRLPAPEETAPDPAAPGFSIPDLPVSVNIGTLALERVDLDESVLGHAAVLSLNGSARLANGGLDTTLQVERLDEPAQIAVNLAFDPATERLAVDLNVQEDEGGLISALLDLPGRPSVDLSVQGEGPLDDYRADIRLATGGEERLDGYVTLQGTGDGGREFAADVSGDLTPLAAPEYREFLGTNIGLVAEGTRAATGAITLDRLELTSAALNIQGSYASNADGAPRSFDLTGQIVPPGGAERVTLPFGTDITLAGADLDVQFNRALSDQITASIVATRPATPDFSAEELRLEANGALPLEGAAEIALDFAASGLEAEDPALAEALGQQVTGSGVVTWAEDAPLRVENLTLDGATYGLTADASFERGEEQARVAVTGDIRADDLTVFAPLTGTDLSGQAQLSLQLAYEMPSGNAQLQATGSASGLQLGIDQLDPLLAPPADLTVDVTRNEEGLTVTTFQLRNDEIRMSAEGQLTNENGSIDYNVRLENAGIFTGADSGPVTLDGTVSRVEDGYRVTGSGGGDDLATGIEPVDQLLAGQATLAYSILTEGSRIVIEQAQVASDELRVTAGGAIEDGVPSVDFTARLANSAIFTGGDRGALELEGDVQGQQDGTFLVNVTGGGDGIGIGNDMVDRLLEGRTDFDVVLQAGGDVLRLERAQLETPQLTLSASGNLAEGERDITATGRLANSAILTGGQAGPLNFAAQAVQEGEEYLVSVEADGQNVGIGNELVDNLLAGRSDLDLVLRAGGGVLLLERAQLETPQLTLSASGNLAEGERNITASGRLANSGALTGGQAGPLNFAAQAVQEGQEYVLNVDANGQNIGIGQPDIDKLLPGRSDLTVRARYNAETGALQVNQAQFDGQAIDASASGSIGEAGATLDLDARLDDLGRLVPELSGPLTVSGQANQQGESTSLDLTLVGPGNTSADVSGRVGLPNGAVDLDVAGTAPLGLIDGFLSRRASLLGQVSFDLSVNGQPGLSALSGTVRAADARLVLPAAQVTVEDIGGTVTLSNGQAQVNMQATYGGGRLAITGPVSLSAPFTAGLEVAIDDVLVERPGLVSTRLDGQLRLTGPLTGNGSIAGRIGLSDTEVRIPDTGFGGVESIPEIAHVNEPADSRATRRRAGLTGEDDGTDLSETSGSGGGGLGLNVLIVTDEPIFLRGRGLEAVLNGSLQLEGTTSDVRPVGRFDLVRGRLDLLTQRLDLTEGSIRLAGSFTPIVRLVATTQSREFVIQIIIDGPVSDPTVDFVSSPDLPEDEIISQLFFSRSISSLSPFQAAQLAAAVATLTGRGDGGVVARIREEAGLDDLDITQTAEGETALSAGKYLSENVYTETQVTSGGETSLSINLDLTDNVTARGSVSTDGETGVGVFFERDY